MTTLLDLQNKINALYGYTPSQGYLLQNPNLTDIALNAIAADVNDLSAIATAYNALFGTSFDNTDLIAQPEKAILGILAIASNTSSLSNLADTYNTLMGTAFTAETILQRPELIRLGLLADWAGVTSLSTITAKINTLFGYIPTTAQLLADSVLMWIGISAIRTNVSDLDAIATAYNTLMGSSYDAASIANRPDLMILGLGCAPADYDVVLDPNNIIPNQNPNNDFWTLQNLSASATAKGFLLTEDNSDGAHNFYAILNIPTNDLYTFNVYARASGRSFCQILLNPENVGSSLRRGYVIGDLVNGGIASFHESTDYYPFVSKSVTTLPTGIFKISFSMNLIAYYCGIAIAVSNVAEPNAPTPTFDPLYQGDGRDAVEILGIELFAAGG